MVNEVYVTYQFSINGDGLYYPAISLYFSGCDKKIKCVNCHNHELQHIGLGNKTNSKEIIETIEKQLLEWLSIYPKMAICYLGGEALAPWNRDVTYSVSKYFKNKYGDKIKNIVYSWRYLEDLEELKDKISYMDLGVLGDFKQELFVQNQVPSSSNQYIYDFNRQVKLPNIIKEDF